jgi:Tol biopolymer transport system component
VDSGGVWRIDTINPDGSGRQTLTRCRTVPGTCGFEFFAWSPDGKRFAFERHQTLYNGSEPSKPVHDDVRLFVVSADGSGETRIPGCGRPWLACGTFTWAPDNRRIAFSRGGSVYVVDTLGGRPVRIIHGHCCSGGPFWSGGPFLSPNGSSILFGSTRGGIYRVNGDGSGLTRLARGSSPSWSPDGRRIVFVSPGNGRPGNSILAMDANGSHVATLFSVGRYSAKHPYIPVWSPDGTQIAFGMAPPYWAATVRAEIWTMRADGTQLRRLYRSGAIDGPKGAIPVWSPDGKLIAFGRPGVQHRGLVLLHASGKPRPRRLAPDAEEFAWQSLPRSTK